MSELGNIKDSYGKQISIGIANTFGDTLLKSNVPSNMLIINAPVDSDKQDIGTSCIFAADNNGEAIRLTYAIQLGNGLACNDDEVSLQIDASSICVNNNNQLYVNTENIIDTQCVSSSNNKIYIDTQKLPDASNSVLGIVSFDDNTVKMLNNSIYVEAENLDRANNTQYGVITSDANTINISDNGIISVVTDNLQKASSTTKGIVKIDKTIQSDEGVLSVSTDNLSSATTDSMGLVKCDNNTVKNVDGVLYVNQENLTKCSTSNYGVAQPDNTSVVITDGVLSVKNYNSIVSGVSTVKEKIDAVTKSITSINEIIASGKLYNYSTPTIFEFICTGVTATILSTPTPKALPSAMEPEKITAEFRVNTNCPFIISVDYINNVAPEVHLYSINYDDVQTYSGNEGLRKQFQSTNEKDKLIRFSFICKNFANSVGKLTETTKIKITVSYTKDNTVSKTVTYHIVRFNSLYDTTKYDNTVVTTDPNNNAYIN